MGRPVLLLAMLGFAGCVRAGFQEADARPADAAAESAQPSRDAALPWGLMLPEDCSRAHWPVTAHTVKVAPQTSLLAAIQTAGPDTTLLLEPGTHALPKGAWITTPRLILRGSGGDRSQVTIDAQGADVGIGVSAPQVVVADLTITNAASDAVHVWTESGPTISGIVLYNLALRDASGHLVHIHNADHGVVGCSSMIVTDGFRSGLGTHCQVLGVALGAARGWRIFGNHIAGVWCAGSHVGAIQLRDGTRDTIIERNQILDPGLGIRAGLATTSAPSGRTYPDPCSVPATTYVDNIGGIIRNNFIAVRAGVNHDSGIAVWNSCDTVVVHNTVFSAVTPFSSIEWRFSNTNATVQNNLVSHNLVGRDDATAVQQANVPGAQAAWFADTSAGDLHLAAAATAAIDKGAVLVAGLGLEDIDRQPRADGKPDVGADER
jgi:hypothetical protein